MPTPEPKTARIRAHAYLRPEPMLLLRLDDTGAEALLTDTRGTWRVLWTAKTGWTCSCPAKSTSCGHVAAARTVIVTAGSDAAGAERRADSADAEGRGVPIPGVVRDTRPTR